MARPALEGADIFRDFGAAWRNANAGHVSLGQRKVMSAIESCRTAALGGHIARCEDCAYTMIAYNSCRNRHCPKCQAAAAREWLAEREAELIPVSYFHVVFTLPAPIADLAYQNKTVIYDLLFKASSETLLTIAADPKHLGGRIGLTAVLHTWGSAMTHHPHVHMIVPGGAISADGSKWVSCRPNFFLPVLVLSKLFRRLMLEKLRAAHTAGRLQFFGDHADLAERDAFSAFLAPLNKTKWFVYAKRPFAGPRAVMAYLSRYTHRVAISNRRLIAADEKTVTFKVKDYRIDGPGRYKTMTLATDEFIRRFLMHVLPKGFHRIRHYGLFANGSRLENIAPARDESRTCSPHRPNRSGAALASLPVLWRAHDHHRNVRAGFAAPLPTVRTHLPHQHRHVMTTEHHADRKAASRRRWFSTGRDGARQSAASRHRRKLRSAATVALDHQPELLRPARRGAERGQRHRARPSTPSAPAKSP